jgi:hypothetical protein
MSQSLSILLPIVAGLLVVLVAIQMVVRHFKNKFREDIKRKFAGKHVVRESIGANFFGQSSRGMAQLRGNGALVLSNDELYFVKFAPRRELVIPLSTVTSISTPRSHLGKTVGWRLLRVDFRSPSGADAAAWAVLNLDEWISDLKRFMKQPIGA